MSYNKAREEARRGVSSEKHKQIQMVVDKSKKLKQRITQTREELSGEISIHSDVESKRQSVDAPQHATAVYTPQQLYPEPYTSQMPLKRDSFVLQTAKLYLDQIEGQLAASKHASGSTQRRKKVSAADEVKSTSQALARYKIITSAMPETDSETEFYQAESACIFVYNVYFLSSYEVIDKPFSLRFVAEVDGIGQQFALFDLTDKSEHTILNDKSPYCMCFCTEQVVVLPYLENSSLAIRCQGKIGDATISAVYELPQFMKGAYGPKFDDQTQLVLQTPELLYDSYFQEQTFQSSLFSLIINQKRFENCIADSAVLERNHILPLKVEMFGIASGYRSQSIQIASSQETLRQSIKKIAFSSRIVEQENNTRKNPQNKQVYCEDEHELTAEQQKTRLVEVQENVFFDEEKNEYFVKLGESAVKEAKRDIKPLQLVKQQYVYSLRDPQEFKSALCIYQLELDCLGEISKSIESIEVSQNNRGKVIARDVPIANGHSLVSRALDYFPYLEHQIAPMYFHVTVASNIARQQLVGSYTFEQLALEAAVDKWIDLKPFGRLRARVCALPPLCGTAVQFLDTEYKIIDINYQCGKILPPQQYVPTFYSAVQKVIPQIPRPTAISLKNVGEMPDFKSELEDVISRLEDCSTGVSVGHESAHYSLSARPVYETSCETQDVNNDLQAARDLIEAVKAAYNYPNEKLPQKEAYETQKCSGSVLASDDISTKVYEMIRDAQISPVLKAAPAQGLSRKPEIQSDSESEETSDADYRRNGSSWARVQARKIFSDDFSDDE